MNASTNEFMVVETVSGLRIVKCNDRNFFSSAYSVQFLGDKDECKAEKTRLLAMERERAAEFTGMDGEFACYSGVQL